MTAGRGPASGFVSLIGAGPGDPGLITVRGRAALMRADVVLYDHLASPALLAAFDRPDQERIHVGKAEGVAFSPQEEITALLVKRALAGQRVARLKGGDPFVFGRGAEEIEALASAGIDFEVIPGVSSVYAAPALAGIPLTHRDHASSFTVVTGHERADAEDGRVDWQAVAAVHGTLVILMGVRTVKRWSQALIDAGRPATTPVAFVRWGSLPRQQVLVTTLGEAADDVAKTQLRSPAVAVVGEVVSLRPTLMSVERQPLFGQVIGLTREDDDTATFAELERLGAALTHVPLLRIAPVDIGVEALAQLLLAMRRGEEIFTDLFFTSANGVDAFRLALTRAGLDTRALAHLMTWAVGPQTAVAMWERLGLNADQVPPRATADGVLAHLDTLGLDTTTRRGLFPSSARARRVLPDGLAARGFRLTEVSVYDTHPEPSAPARLLSALEEGLTLLVLASPSAVDSLVSALDTTAIPRARIQVAAIGPTTAEAARQAGLEVAVVPPTFSLSALADALVVTLARPGGGPRDS